MKLNKIFVVDNTANKISVFSRSGDGDIAPLRTIQGPLALLEAPNGVAIDSLNNELWVSNAVSSGENLTVYSRTASGDIAPLRTVTDMGGMMGGFQGVMVDSISHEVWISTQSPALLAYPLTANGYMAPSRLIQGAATKLSNPVGIALCK